MMGSDEDLCFKTGSYSLVICASKSPRRFLGLCLKIKWATVYRLRHKTDGRMKTARDTCRDLAACFAWKQVRLGFLKVHLGPRVGFGGLITNN
jgi:hypothetical protein